MKFKKGMLAIGIIMGIMCGFSFMVPDNALAAVLVFDAKNVEEAIKTAITTADILTNEQKRLALQLLDMKKIDDNQLADYVNEITKQQQQATDEKNAQTGPLKPSSTVQSFWDEQFPNIDSVLSGRTTVMDAYLASQKSMPAMERTNEDALRMAKTTQVMADSVAKSTQDALNNSAQAQGNIQAQQANTQANAAGTMATMQSNNLLANLVAMQAVKYQRELQEEAIARALIEQSVTKLQTATEGCNPQPVSFEEFMSAMGETYNP